MEGYDHAYYFVLQGWLGKWWVYNYLNEGNINDNPILMKSMLET